MTRAIAVKIERRLRGIGVYKPYVTAQGDRLEIESYPLTAIITTGFDDEMGPTHNVKITDCTMARLGQSTTISTMRVFIGQDLIGTVGQLLVDFHAPAYARACEQDGQSVAREMAARDKSVARVEVQS